MATLVAVLSVASTVLFVLFMFTIAWAVLCACLCSQTKDWKDDGTR